ncbi:MAG TPA: hypothetical protein VFW16_04670, partial [Streptosporangiaceae bacterium]|nr:hypothetical protein [Streptosporangiaceae bacterium]
IGVPLYANLSDKTVRLLSMQLVRVPSAVHIVGLHVYSSRGLSYGQITFLRGSLSAECPKFFGHPRPVSDGAIQPRRSPPWIITIVVRISRPGHYVSTRAKISYSTGGTRGWQYQNLPLYALPPPDRRLRIDPASSIC